MQTGQLEEIIRAGKEEELNNYAIALCSANLNNPEGYMVHDGPKREFTHIACGEPAYQTNFVVTGQAPCGRIPAVRWSSVTEIKTGDFVRKLDPNGQAILHLVLSSSADNRVWRGYSDRSSGISVAYNAQEIPNYPGGVGRCGINPPAGRQLIFI